MSTPIATPPAGWYDDPEYPATERWWDGQGWSDARRAFYAAPVAAVQHVVVNEPAKRVNHLLHLVLTILTAGLWLPVWLIIALAKS